MPIRQRLLLLSLFLLALTSMAWSQLATAPSSDRQSPESTQSPESILLGSLLKHEPNDERPVFIMFSATWCGWCHKLADFFVDPEIKPLFDRRFRFAELHVAEDDAHISLVLPGTRELMKTVLGHGGGSLPCYAVVDVHGKRIITSNPTPRENIGYPTTKTDLAYFFKIFDSSGVLLTRSERRLITAKLRAHHDASPKQVQKN